MVGELSKRAPLLVEAKAHIGELRSDCSAKSTTSITKIQRAFADVKRSLGAPVGADWSHGYYQTANRIATLYFLHRESIDAQLLFVYFIGDNGDARRQCPQTEDEWMPELREQNAWLALPADHRLKHRIHELFLHV